MHIYFQYNFNQMFKNKNEFYNIINITFEIQNM